MPSFAIRVTNEQKKSEKRKKENAGGKTKRGKKRKKVKKKSEKSGNKKETKNGEKNKTKMCHLTFALQACLLSCLAGFGRTGNTFMLILLLNLYEATAGMFVSFYCAFFKKLF